MDLQLWEQFCWYMFIIVFLYSLGDVIPKLSSQMKVNRLTQTMQDLDQEERALDMKLKVINYVRARNSIMQHCRIGI